MVDGVIVLELDDVVDEGVASELVNLAGVCRLELKSKALRKFWSCVCRCLVELMSSLEFEALVSSMRETSSKRLFTKCGLFSLLVTAENFGCN